MWNFRQTSHTFFITGGGDLEEGCRHPPAEPAPLSAEISTNSGDLLVCKSIGGRNYLICRVSVGSFVYPSKFKILLHDPLVKKWSETNKIVNTKMPDIKLIQLMVFLVKHKQFNHINFEKLKKKNKNFFIIDANNVLTKKQILKINKLNIKNYILGK